MTKNSDKNKHNYYCWKTINIYYFYTFIFIYLFLTTFYFFIPFFFIIQEKKAKMSIIQETPCIWSDSALIYQQPTSVVTQMQTMLTIDDDEIYNSEDEDYTDLPAPKKDYYDSVSSSDTDHIQYVNTVRKTRPLPKIPERSSSKELTDNTKAQNKLTARQLFEMLSDDRITDIETSEEDGGVYALKTQIPSPKLTNNKPIQHASYQYENFNSNHYKMMTPVQEVEEEQLFNNSNNNEEYKSFEQYNDIRPISGTSFGTPSLTSGRTSPSQHSIDSIDPYTPNQKENDQDPLEEDVSLVSDVRRLSALNQALMTPVISNKIIDNAVKPVDASSVELGEDYRNINTASPQAMTSFSLTNNKESIKTYRRMATKTHDKNIQFTYAKYLMQLVSFGGTDTRDRLQEEVEYWIEKLAKANHAEALYIKGQWHSHCCDKSVINLFVGSQYKKVNHVKAFKCFQQAAKFGSTEAHYELAEYWKDRKEYKKALSSYKFAASKNHILALYVSSKIK